MLKKYFFTIIVTLLILVLIVMPLHQFPKIESPGFALDKAVHMFIFLFWEITILIESKGNFKLVNIFGLGVLFGITTELLQLFTKDRQFDLYDAMYDCFGLGLGILIWIIITFLFKRNKTQLRV